MVTIRPARPADWQVLQTLNDAVFQDNAKYDPDIIVDWAFSEDGIKYFKALANGDKYVCFVAEVDGEAVGYIAAQAKEISYRKSKYFEVDSIGVLPAFRSQGIGYQLMDACKQYAKEHGFQKLYVNCYSRNDNALAFYKKCGFDEIDRSMEVAV